VRGPIWVKPIVPDKDCHFLTKVRHSAFYATSLGYLLGRLETKRLTLTGQVTEQCILYTRVGRLCTPFHRRGPAGCGGAHRRRPRVTPRSK